MTEVAVPAGEQEVRAVAGEVGAGSETLEVRLGRQLRARRRARGLTLKQVAQRASLSHPFLSQLERGLARPSMASLERIAHALGTSQLELLAAAGPQAGATGDAPSVVRAHEGVVGPYGAGSARLLATGRRRLEPLEFTGWNAEPGEHYFHAEDEFFTVLEGALTVSLGDHGEWTLGPGDSLYCPSGTPHRWHSADGDRYRLLIVKEAFGSHRADTCGPPEPGPAVARVPVDETGVRP